MAKTTSNKKSSESKDALIGKSISKLKLPMTGNKEFNVKDYSGRRVVLYFYPKDMTSGCTREGHDFTALISDFKKQNTIVLGISRDSISKHEKFIEKEGYKLDLISDENEDACSLFDVIKEKNMYGKKVLGIERSTFLIGVDGKVEHVWRKVKVDGHAQEVLDFVKKNK